MDSTVVVKCVDMVYQHTRQTLRHTVVFVAYSYFETLRSCCSKARKTSTPHLNLYSQLL